MDLHEFLSKFTSGYDSVPEEEPWSSLVTANLHSIARRPAAALEVLDALKGTDDETETCLRILVRVRAYLQVGRAAEALHLLESVSWENRHGVLKARLLLPMGIAHRLLNHAEDALSFLTMAKTMFDSLEMPLDRAVCEAEIGSLLLSRGDVGAATSNYLSALDAFEAHGSALQKIAVRSNLAIAMQRSGNNDGAERELRALLDTPPFDAKGADRAQVLHNLAVIAKSSGRYQQSLDLYEEALACVDFTTSPATHIRMRVGVAELAFRVGDIVTADAELVEVDRLVTAETRDLVNVEYHSLRSRVHGLSERYHEAQERLTEALESARASDLVDEEYLLLRESLDWVHGPMRTRYLEDLIRIQDRRNENTSKSITSLIDLRSRYEQEKSAREIERQQEITRTVLETQTRLFEEIGRDIHDSVGQDLTVLRLMTERLTSGQFPSKEMQEIHTRMHEIVRRVESDTRRISHLVSGMGVTGIGLRDALATIKEDISKGASRLEIELVISNGLEHIPDDVARTILRCGQTLLQNILRHSQAASCIIQLLVHPTEIVFSVEDDGVGFDRVRVQKGLGLRELFARTEVVGGNLAIDSTPGHGTFIEITIPRKDIE